MGEFIAAGSPCEAFERFREEVKCEVDAALATWLDARGAEARRLGADVDAMSAAARTLVVRGGKRLRAVLLAAAYVACGGDGGARAVAMAGVSLELLQGYLLIHDDWMDGDDVRRGGPSVHAALRTCFGSLRAGEVAGILAGDYTAALAQQALFEVPLPPARVVEAAQIFAKTQVDVTCGQLLDVRAMAEAPEAVEVMHSLKTGSYTVHGPIGMGAALAGASADTRATLGDFARPLGIAFQLRDDLLGTFGDPKTTGKPQGSDLLRGKRTALVVELERDAEGRRLLPRVFGVDDASADEVKAVVARMISSGARARVEARLLALMRQSAAALEPLELVAAGKEVLRGAVLALGERER